jgi:hypothetical protein
MRDLQQAAALERRASQIGVRCTLWLLAGIDDIKDPFARGVVAMALAAIMIEQAIIVMRQARRDEDPTAYVLGQIAAVFPQFRPPVAPAVDQVETTAETTTPVPAPVVEAAAADVASTPPTECPVCVTRRQARTKSQQKWRRRKRRSRRKHNGGISPKARTVLARELDPRH